VVGRAAVQNGGRGGRVTGQTSRVDLLLDQHVPASGGGRGRSNL
jgi:hypothetical protein